MDNGNPTTMQKAFSKAGVKVRTSSQDMQNEFLSKLMRNKQLVQLEAIEGIGWRGFIKSFDNFSLIIVGEQSQAEELIFKHSIKSIKAI